MSSDDFLDQSAPSVQTLALLGAINFTWAQLDLISSAAFAALLKIDPVELGITLGRVETRAKIIKMHHVARHRRDKETAKSLSEVKKELARLRPARNATTHGSYLGKTNKGELLFKIPAEFIIDDGADTAHELYVLTISELQQHIVDTTKVATGLMSAFPRAELEKLFYLRSRVRQKNQKA